MNGRTLAINEGFGYRPIMVVKAFNFLPQFNERPPSTWVYGDQIMWPSDNQVQYTSFMRSYYGLKIPWAQVGAATELDEDQLFAIFPRLPIRLVAEEPLVLLSAGKDPIAGYYVQFAGAMQLFSQPDWWVETEQY